ncbi:MAG: acyl carrier protein [Bacteroidales bacterium]|nr:acyl carrier protein [Lachnoclostridium sp.]MCM1384353.1 acyl carrier protein [Lachnoclostridium sp.]MCM1464934.1 acyl carrier protein [Bacteroidales bacterium]
MFEKIQKMVAEGLGVEESKVVESASFQDDLDADSLDLYELAMAFEEEFGVEIPAEDLEKLVTVGDVVKYIQEHQ